MKRIGGARGSVSVTALVLSSLLAGCQAVQGHERNGEADFPRLWSLYRECQQERDRERLQLLAQELLLGSHAARSRDEHDGIGLSFPLSAPPVRLAVDPEEMARACARQEARAATGVGARTDSAPTALSGAPDARRGMGHRGSKIESL